MADAVDMFTRSDDGGTDRQREDYKHEEAAVDSGHSLGGNKTNSEVFQSERIPELLEMRCFTTKHL